MVKFYCRSEHLKMFPALTMCRSCVLCVQVAMCLQGWHIFKKSILLLLYQHGTINHRSVVSISTYLVYIQHKVTMFNAFYSTCITKMNNKKMIRVLLWWTISKWYVYYYDKFTRSLNLTPSIPLFISLVDIYKNS